MSLSNSQERVASCSSHAYASFFHKSRRFHLYIWWINNKWLTECWRHLYYKQYFWRVAFDLYGYRMQFGSDTLFQSQRIFLVYAKRLNNETDCLIWFLPDMKCVQMPNISLNGDQMYEFMKIVNWFLCQISIFVSGKMVSRVIIDKCIIFIYPQRILLTNDLSECFVIFFVTIFK